MMDEFRVIGRRTRAELNKLRRDQKGQAFILALILLALGSVIAVPLLTYMGTGLKVGKIYDTKKGELYAADAGIEDAQWRIKYDHMPDGYDTYAYDTNWTTPIAQQINNNNVNVTIRNVWIPKDVDWRQYENPPYNVTPKDIVEANKLIVTGTTIQTGIILPDGNKISQYKIKVTYYPGADENLSVYTLGIWLPRGYEYYKVPADPTHKSNLEDNLSAPYYKVPAASQWMGNQAMLWSYASAVPFTSFPNVHTGDFPMTLEVTFYFKPLDQSHPDDKPDAVAWIKTGGGVWDIPYSWDADVKVLEMVSAAGSTTVNSYISKSEVRKMQAAIAGDYYATGNSLLSDSDGDYNRETWHDPSSATVTNSNIPTDAEVTAAFLYWSGWKNDGSVTTVLNDSCSSFTPNWNNGTSWSVLSNTFGGHQSSGSTRYLTLANSQNLSSYSLGAVTVSWDQWVAALSAIFSDTCTSSNFSNYWQNGGDWSYYSSGYYRARHTSSSDSYRYLTHSQNLSSYTTTTVTVSWDWWTSSSMGANAGLDLYLSRDGTNFDYKVAGFRGSKTSTEHQSYAIPVDYLTSNFKMRFIVTGSSSDYPSGKYCYIDNISITPDYSTTDGLDFAFSGDGGSTWSGDIQAFRGNIGTSQPSSNNFIYAIPSQYLTANFKFRFYLIGCGGTAQYCKIDNIKILARVPDTSIVFKIDDGSGAKQVYLDGDGNPHQGTQELTASKSQVLRNYAGTSSHGFSYSSYRDVTALVRQYSKAPTPPATNYPGYATYWVGGVYSDTPRDGESEDQWAYANWSLIIIYTSADTQGHQLYLFDKFIYSNQDTDNGINVDFDSDGDPGGTISGFIVPARTRDQDGNSEVNAAKITCYVGEGDLWFDGDYLAVNGTKLWDGTTTTYDSKINNSISNPNNVFNSTSMGFSTYDGIDIDTLGIDPPNGRYITWDSGILHEGDTSAHIDMVTHTDVWNLVYIILSFRSSTTTGGAINYLIR